MFNGEAGALSDLHLLASFVSFVCDAQPTVELTLPLALAVVTLSALEILVLFLAASTALAFLCLLSSAARLVL